MSNSGISARFSYLILGSQDPETIGKALSRHKGIGPGFDLLRILLALAIFAGHAKWIAGSESIGAMFPVGEQILNDGNAVNLEKSWAGFTAPIKLFMVPAFFALSGFLVAGSAFRLKAVSTFLAHRGLRIFPALIVEVIFSAIILGPIFTITPIGEYFSQDQFFRYFGNAFGIVTYELPGVFLQNPVSGIVNANLWTLPSEFYCYLIAALLMGVSLFYDRKIFSVTFVLVTIALATAHAFSGISAPDGPFPMHVIVYYFFCGVMFFHWKEFIPARISIFLISGIITYLSLFFNSLIYFTPVFLVYTVVFFGLIEIPKMKFISSGDYSYGIYLYGFPVSQAMIATFPQLYGRPIILILASAVVTYAFSVFSWHCIEKHALKLKKKLSAKWFPVVPRERIAAAAVEPDLS